MKKHEHIDLNDNENNYLQILALSDIYSPWYATLRNSLKLLIPEVSKYNPRGTIQKINVIR